ncbi:MAG TPA: single-stranded-DNA-specific exonuclease RecJ [Chitinophagaceae bacterium]|nr:single-stranded-DNA-specific exonuclease RecJ [Chitinophagaceae bacterium]
MEKRWNLLRPDEQDVARLQQELGISAILCRILVERGVRSYQEAHQFFRPSLESLHDPFLMKDMNLAVDRVMHAMVQRERILVYGDYDVDGTTAVGCMYRFLCRIYEKDLVDFYIPHRYREGYGVSRQGVEHAIENGYKLVIALDCGIKSQELIRYAKDHGVDFIVCDHHIPDELLPPAVAILNPKQKDCLYPYKELCGCGVGLKLITAIVKQSDLPDEYWMECLELTATAIAADIVPMTGENRVIAYYGLKRTNENPSVALKALMNVSGMKGKVLIQHLVFMIAPRVNAAGRMDDARKVVNLFIENDFDKAAEFAKELHSDNADRKEADLSITKEALSLIREYETTVKRKSTVVYQPHWHKGVVGIVASRLIEHYYRPTIVLTKSGDVVAGSARSIPGFNIHDGLEQCKDLLLGFGGHYFAAGMTMLPENVEAFSARFNEVVEGLLLDHYFTPEIRIDAEVSIADCNRKFYDIVHQMEPFGPENPQPVLVARGLKDTGHSKVVKDLHLRLVVKQENSPVISGIGFNLADKYQIVNSGMPFDVVFTLDENEWQGNVSLQMKVIDIKAAEK